MSLLSIIGDVVGIAAAVMSGGALGIVMGALVAVNVAQQAGLIGGSIGKFMSSGWGVGLMAACSLGSMAYAEFGQSALAAGEQQATASAASFDASTGMSSINEEASAIATNNGILNDAGAGSAVGAIAQAAPEAQAATGTASQSLNDLNSAQGPTGINLGANASGAAATNTAQDQALAGQNSAGLTGGAPSPAPTTPPVTPAGPAAAQAAVAPGAVPGSAGDPNAALTGVAPPGPDAYKAMPAGAPSSSGGFLSKAAGMIDQHPGLAQVAGQAISGAAAGASQQKQIEEMIAAQEWGNLQWQNQGEVAQLQGASARPITVPQGYLQRAQAVRGLMAGSQGIQPTQGPVPGSPIAPPPVPPAMRAPTVAAPAGGMI